MGDEDKILERKYARQNLDSCFKHIRSSVEASVNDLEMTVGPILDLRKTEEYQQMLDAIERCYGAGRGQVTEGESDD